MSDIVSDLSGPVGAPSGPTEGVTAEPAVASSIIIPGDNAPASIVGAPELTAPAPVAAIGGVLLAVEAPWYIKNFNPSIEGCPIITSAGTSVPAQFVEQAISAGVANGVSIVKR